MSLPQVIFACLPPGGSYFVVTMQKIFRLSKYQDFNHVIDTIVIMLSFYQQIDKLSTNTRLIADKIYV